MLSSFTYAECNSRNTPRSSHGLGAVIAVGTSTIPVTLHGFGIKGHNHTKLFSNSVQDVTSHPQVVTHFDTFTGPNLELPLKMQICFNLLQVNICCQTFKGVHYKWKHDTL